MKPENNNHMAQASEKDLDKILRSLGIEALTSMQEAALRSDEEGRDMILLAPTGSGKTVAFLLPLLRRLDAAREGVQAVIMTPSRELALQTEQVFKAMKTPFRIMSCYGGRPAMEEHRVMRQLRPAVIAGTPGRLNDHLSKRNFEPSDVWTLVIDEFDKCLELGFRDEMSAVIAQLPCLRKRYLLSATDAEEIPRFVGLRSAVKLDFLQEKELLAGERLQVSRVQSPEKDKLRTLYRLLCSFGGSPAIVFANHRDAADRIGRYLVAAGLSCGVFHGGMEQEDRERVLFKFRNGSCHTLVATDLAARGLDIPEVGQIVHYHLPPNEDAYLHRNGRTARWKSSGHVCLLLGPEEQLPDYCGSLPERSLPACPPAPEPPRRVTLYIGRGRREKLSRTDVVGFLCKQGRLAMDEIGQVEVRDHYALVAISRAKLKQTLALAGGEKIKGMKTLIEEMRD